MDEKLQAARVRAVKTLPYFSSALFAMPIIETEEVELLAADKDWRMYANPKAIQEESSSELAGRMVHLLMHLLRDHAGRCERAQMNPEKFALSADLEINDDLRSDHVVMPPESQFPEDYEFETGDVAEAYYRQLPDQPGQPQSQEGQQQKQAEQQSAKDGSCCNGDEQEYEVDEGKARKVSPQEAERLKKDAARKIKEESKKGRGDVPAGLERWAEDQLDPQVNWRKELASRIRNAVTSSSGMQNYTYNRPSRRRMPNVIMPSMVGYEPSVAVVIDTSGSMSNKELSQAVAEVGGILKSCGIKRGLDVISVDAEVGNAKKVFNKNQIELAGGGGTNMRVGIDWVQENKPETDVCIVVTDGFTPWGDSKPKGMDCIAVLTDEGGRDTPSWIKPIEVKL